MEADAVFPKVGLTDYSEVLKRRAWVIAAFFVVCSASVTLGTFLATPLYMASTKIIVEGESTNVLDATDSSSRNENFNIFENYIETQIAVIKSDKIAGGVFKEFKLEETPRYRQKVIMGKTFKRKFSSDISIERLRDTRMIEIHVFNPDPQTAADLANRITDVYAQDNMARRALTFIRNQQMGSLNADFLRLQSKLASLSNTLGPMHPEMIALEKEISDMSNRIKNERVGGAGGKPLADDQTLLEDTLLKVQASSVFSSSKMSNIAVVDRAVVPTDIAKPRRLLNIALGILLGLVGGVLLAFFVDYLDDTIKSEEDVKGCLGKGLYLGFLPSIKGNFDKRSSLDQLVMDSKNSVSAEAYRILRTRILWSTANQDLKKNLIITSCIPEEGKTTVASNLAITLSRLNIKVLLVDTDTRRGRIAESYQLSNEKGLANYLAENLDFESVVKSTSIPGLSIVTCGTSDIDSWQLFHSPQMKKFVAEAGQKFDQVVYDTAPMIVISDTLLLISMITGGVVLTSRSRVTSTRLLKKALSMIQEAGANLSGVVLNDLTSTESRAYGHYHNAYQKRPKN